jgi:hypothetical protein
VDWLQAGSLSVLPQTLIPWLFFFIWKMNLVEEDRAIYLQNGITTALSQTVYTPSFMDDRG